MATNKTVQRDRAAEEIRAKGTRALAVAEIAAARHEGSLGDDHIKLAQVLLMCSLPHSRTDKTQVSRKARLGDGSHLMVTLTSMTSGVALPFGRDRKLLAWIFDRAIRNDDPFVPWTAASEYQREMGLPEGGKSNKELQARFARIASLGINIERTGNGVKRTRAYAVLSDSVLPQSITGYAPETRQTALPGMENKFGIQLSTDLFDDIRRYNYALPRMLWQTLTGPSQVQDIALWLFVRCYAAGSETVIPWSALHEQFGAEDSNPRRLKTHAREAVRVLMTLWPEARVAEDADGIRVQKINVPLLPDDAGRKRVRRLT
jgi:Plasmid encoded RepA protein